MTCVMMGGRTRRLPPRPPSHHHTCHEGLGKQGVVNGSAQGRSTLRFHGEDADLTNFQRKDKSWIFTRDKPNSEYITIPDDILQLNTPALSQAKFFEACNFTMP